MIDLPTQPGSAASGDATPGECAVVAVIPCWNRPGDLVALLHDLAGLEGDARFRVLIVDNGSDVPLERRTGVAEAADALRRTAPVRFIRLGSNTGGSGGFNAGMAEALREDAAYIWLIDSDARVEPGCLAALLETAESRGPVAAVGASIADPSTGRVFETGARLDRETGRLVPQGAPSSTPIEVDYAAACCLLVPADSVRRAGLMPDLFLHSDDVAFGLRLRRTTGLKLLAAPAALCRHPRFDRYKTWARYYEARNWIVPAMDAGLGVKARVRRAWREIVLAVGQMLIGRGDLALLHTRGLTDAAAGRVSGRASEARTRVRRTWPMHALTRSLDAIAPAIPGSAQPMATVDVDVPLKASMRQTVKKTLTGHGLSVSDRPARESASRVEALSGLFRVLLTPPAAIAVVNAKAPPHAWCAGRIVVAVSPEGFTIRRMHTLDRLAAVTNVLARGLLATVRLAVRPPQPPRSPAADDIGVHAPQHPGNRPTLSVVILTRDRIAQLLRTIEHLRADEVGAACEIVVVDNGSADGTPGTLRERFPDVTLVETSENLGVEGFNRGVAASSGEAVLILDDDAWPAPGALGGALDLLRDRPGVAGVMLHRRHPRTSEWEWPFESHIDDPTGWPDMGSGNLIRREAWDAVDGYEAGYFLYRNDTDMALTLLASGRDVVFTPGLHVWHDSPIAKTKSAAWLTRSTRNWIWLCKRHGKGGSGLMGIAMGWAWAHRLAGLSPAKQVAALRGALSGIASPAPPLPKSIRPNGLPLGRLIRLKRTLRG